MNANGSREQLMQAFDSVQNRYEILCKAKEKTAKARSEETDALNNYNQAKKLWDEKLLTCSPGDLGGKEKL